MVRHVVVRAHPYVAGQESGHGCFRPFSVGEGCDVLCSMCEHYLPYLKIGAGEIPIKSGDWLLELDGMRVPVSSRFVNTHAQNLWWIQRYP